MKKIIVLASVVAATLSAPAFSQVTSEDTIGGAKVGLVMGYDDFSIKYDGERGSKSGFLYGVTVGYDYNVGSAIVGLEAEVNDATTKQTLEEDGDTGSLAAQRELYIGARVGAQVGGRLLAYAKAGYVNAKLKASANIDGDRYSESDTIDGYRLGAGLEYAPGAYFSRLEYRFSDFGKYEYAGYDTGLSANRHQVVATLGVRF